MFNVDETAYLKFKRKRKFQDNLLDVAKLYNKFGKSYDSIMFTLNEHLKYFSLLDSWRREICFSWDTCRQSLICATATYEEKIKNKYQTKRQTKERIYYTNITEYYLENTLYRLFSILDKLSHALNLVLNLGFKERDVSFPRVRDKLINTYPQHRIIPIIEMFESRESLHKILRETRNAMTHREGPLDSSLSFEQVTFEVPEGFNEEGYVSAVIPILNKPKLTLEELYEVVHEYYEISTRLINFTLMLLLLEISEKYEKELMIFRDTV